MKNYVVTGATGFIGKSLCKLLLDKGHKVYTVSKKTDSLLSLIGVKFIYGNWWEVNNYSKIIKKVHCFIHLAGNAKFSNGPNYIKENYENTKFILKYIEKKNRKIKFIFISSIGALDREIDDFCEKKLGEDSKYFPVSDYGKSKMLCEKYLRKSKLKNVIIRPSLVVGEQMRTDSHFNVFTKLAIKRSLFCRIDWTGSMSVVDVKDLSKVIYFLSFKKFKNKSEIFMCSGKEICIGNFFDKINPKIFKIKISKFLKYFILRIGYVPFKFKCLLFRALVGSDKKINNFNIKLENKISQVFKKLELKEKYLSDPVKFGPPSGITIITGASSGIGREYLNYLIKTRNIIYAVDKNIDVLKNLKKKYKKKLVLKKIDLTNHQLLKDFLNNLLKKNILISEIFACAGIGKRGKITETEFEKHKEIFDLNVLSIIMLVRRALLNMSYLNYGNIVIISSSAAFQTLPNIASYAASKMAIKSLGEALVVENENKNINILNIFPGGAKTNFQKTAGVKVLKNEKLLTSEEIVVKSLFALKKKKSYLIISLKAKIMYLIGKLFPNVFLLKLYKLAMNKVR